MNNNKEISNLFSLISDLFANNEELNKNVESIDLTTKEGKERFNQLVSTLNDNPLFKLLYYFAGGKNFEEDMDILKNFAENIEEKPTIKKPSELLDNVDVKLQLHKLVEEYTNEHIKPYVSNDEHGQKLANDAYAGLFEYSCWLYNKK